MFRGASSFQLRSSRARVFFSRNIHPVSLKKGRVRRTLPEMAERARAVRLGCTMPGGLYEGAYRR